MKITCLIRVSFLILVSGFTYAQTAIYYLSPTGSDANSGRDTLHPFATLNRALVEIRTQRATIEGKQSAHEIRLLEGTYLLREPVVLRPEDSGSERTPLVITAHGRGPVTISGGQKITGWKKARNGLWVTTIPKVKNGNWKFRQIYVNDKLRHRARKPNEGFLTVKGFPEGTSKTVHYHTDCQSFEFAEGDINPNWRHMEDVEVIVYHFWTDSHLPIQSIDSKKNIVTFKHKAGKVFTDDFTENGARYIVENVFEELDAPGEWYLDKASGRLFYMPLPDEDINTVEIYAPVIPELIKFEGDPANGRFVENIRFKDLEFKCTNWELPEGNSNDRQGSASVIAAITMKGTRNCSFIDCRISNLGTWAFELQVGCRNNKFAYNTIDHIAAGGFRVNGGNYEDHPLLRTNLNKITDNHLHHYGEVYPSAVGILLMHTEDNLVAHNHIHHGFYTGISIGWNWGYQRSISRDNVIEYNHIHDIGQGLLSDMGAIYTLGVSPGTVLNNNLIHDVNANHYGGWGIYHDEGSSHILVKNNVVYNTKFAGFNIHFCKEVTVRNNIFAFGKLQQLSRGRAEPHKSVFFERNIVYWKDGVLLDKNWEDTPYMFHFHPKNKNGTREIQETFDMDWNIYFNPDKRVDEIDFNGHTFDKWQALGKDKHSRFTDPMFVDPDNYDFTLKPDSPAFDFGFQNIDITKVGIRKKANPHSSNKY